MVIPSPDFTLGYLLFDAFKLTKNADSDRCSYSEYGVGFDARGSFSLTDDSEFGKNVIILGVDVSSSVHIDNKKRDSLFLGKGPTDGLDDTTMAVQKNYSINFTEQDVLLEKLFYVCIIIGWI